MIQRVVNVSTLLASDRDQLARLYITVVNRSEATACNKHGAMKLWFLFFLETNVKYSK